MANPKVVCRVDQCTHWMNGNQCMAAKIGIFNNEETSESSTAADTQCKVPLTLRPLAAPPLLVSGS